MVSLRKNLFILSKGEILLKTLPHRKVNFLHDCWPRNVWNHKPALHKLKMFTLCLASVSAVAAAIQKMTRVRVVDNSSLGNTPYHRAPRVIHVYTKNGVGKVGDRVLLAIKGQKKKALIVGHKMPGERMSPRFDSNNVVLIEDNGNPTGTRIKVPIPTHLRTMEGDYSKVLAIASSFV